MILNKIVISIIFSTSCLQIICGAGYSKVYVHRGAEEVPVEYLNYGAPPVVRNPQIAQISAAPIGSVLPLQNVVSGCVAPCVIPSQSVNTVAAVPTSSKIIAYNTPNVPTVVLPNSDEKTSYEYSYVVYDENTGDRKAQRELSDGSVVQGEYSFIQPDGYVREVKYRADDLTGFNAIVKNFLPESTPDEDAKKPTKKGKSEPDPACQPIQTGALKVDSELTESTEITVAPTVESAPEVASVSIKESEAIVVIDSTTPDANSAFSTESSVQLIGSPLNSPAALVENPSATKAIEPPTDNSVELIKDSTSDSTSAEPDHDIINCTDETHTHEAVETPIETIPKPEVPLANGLVSYKDIIRCVQAAIANGDPNANTNISPLTYIILPGTNKPC
ncbi:uncharacterized protein LOC113511581 [Galleria mellonella]|uniref:Amyelois LOC106132319-like protein n=1 Tax=Galleria mellonella TaxID=7137 RepID=A0A3G1T171_GALME|nr:uncharacterized protein LOC113511581 [Galleria mellonella]AXY94722.1 amyelois LOC106132319-like protein [Galleria mellonella]